MKVIQLNLRTNEETYTIRHALGLLITKAANEQDIDTLNVAWRLLQKVDEVVVKQ